MATGKQLKAAILARRPAKGPRKRRATFEQALNLGAAAVTLAAAFGLDPRVPALSLAPISVGLAVSAWLPR